MAPIGVALFKRLMCRAVRRVSNGLSLPARSGICLSQSAKVTAMNANIDIDRYEILSDFQKAAATLQGLKESGTDGYEAQKALNEYLKELLYEGDDSLKSVAGDGKAEYRGRHGWDIPSDISFRTLNGNALDACYDGLADELLPRDGSKYATPSRGDGDHFRVPVGSETAINPNVNNSAEYRVVAEKVDSWLEATEPAVADGGGRFGRAKERAKKDEEPVNGNDDPEDQESDLTPAEQALTGAENIAEATAPGVLRFLNNNPEAVDTILGELESVESYETAEVDALAAEVGEERANELRSVFPDKTDEQLIAFEG